MKKEKLNNELYRIHLRAAQKWGNVWYVILDSVHVSINQELERKYKTIDDKFKKLVHSQIKKPDNSDNFTPGLSTKPT
jgi:hypothetical protein